MIGRLIGWIVSWLVWGATLFFSLWRFLWSQIYATLRIGRRKRETIEPPPVRRRSKRRRFFPSFSCSFIFFPFKYIFMRFVLFLRWFGRKIRNLFKREKRKKEPFTEYCTQIAQNEILESPSEIVPLSSSSPSSSSPSSSSSSSSSSSGRVSSGKSLLPQEHAMDSYYFNGFSENGDVFILRLCRRAYRWAEVWLAIWDSESGAFLQLPCHPFTSVPSNEATQTTKFSDRMSAGGVTIKGIEPMKRWELSFEGSLRVTGFKQDWTCGDEEDHFLGDSFGGNGKALVGDLIYVKFHFHWTAMTDPFNFDQHITSMSVGDGVASQPWSFSLMSELRKSHHTHIEQWGALKGLLYIRWNTPLPILSPLRASPERRNENGSNHQQRDFGNRTRWIEFLGMRDRSYPTREWKKFRRYAVHCCNFEDGTSLHLSLISSTTFQQLVTGYLITPSGRVDGLNRCTLSLNQLGENGDPPSRYKTTFWTQSGQVYQLHVEIVTRHLQFNVADEVRIFEQFGRFRLKRIHGIFSSPKGAYLNEVVGRGIAEYCYRLDDFPQLSFYRSPPPSPFSPTSPSPSSPSPTSPLPFSPFSPTSPSFSSLYPSSPPPFPSSPSSLFHPSSPSSSLSSPPLAPFSLSLSASPSLSSSSLSSSLSSSTSISRTQSDLDPLVVELGSHESASVSLVGGKGASLSLLTWYSRSFSPFSSPLSDDVGGDLLAPPHPIFHPKTILLHPALDPPLVWFSVPLGFCVTSISHDIFVQSLSEANLIDTLLKEATMVTNPNSTQPDSSQLLEEICESLQDIYTKSPLPPSLISAIQSSFEGTFAPETPVSVRSSAITEDTADVTAAGQLETYLGVQGWDSVCSCLKKCWASQYSVRSVRYRVSQGLPVRSTMGVVIQEMIYSRVSGVCFSAHPVTANREKVCVSANYGLCKSIVDGTVTPDTFEVNRRFGVSDESPYLEIESSRIGSKTSKEILIDEGVTTVPTEKDDASALCATDSEILRVADVTCRLEWIFGGTAQDVEWTFDQQNRLFLLQARPITVLSPLQSFGILGTPTSIPQTITPDSQDSKWKIAFQELVAQTGGVLAYRISEFDTPSTGNEWNTTYNIGEMLPSAATPLTLSTFGWGLEWGLQDLYRISGGTGWPVRLENCQKMVTSKYGHLHMNITALGAQHVYFSTGDKRGSDTSLAGRVLDEITPENLLSYHSYMEHPLQRHVNSMAFFHMLWSSQNRMNYLIKLSEQIKLGKYLEIEALAKERNWSAAQIYNHLNELMTLLFNIWRDTIHYSAQSGVWSAVLMKILARDGTWETKHHSDVSKLLSKCTNVFSAEIASLVERLGKNIWDEMQGQKLEGKEELEENGKDEVVESEELGKERVLFWEMTTQEAVEWLNSSHRKEETRSNFQRLMKIHGHRGIREAEVMEQCWADNPQPLISTLQRVAQRGRPSENQAVQPTAIGVDAINHLESLPGGFKGWIIKKIMRWIVPKARRSVGDRELGKSTAVMIHNQFKRCYRYLAEVLTQKERVLPDKRLIYFLSHYELKKLCSHKSVRELVQVARERLEAFEFQKSLVFPPLVFGEPQPIRWMESHGSKSTKNKTLSPGLSFSGMPVSPGVVTARVCVIQSLKETDNIEEGDILIAPYTDVCWTVYFPLLSGLVTELGGLLAHGAVCAREYGIPCVVNVPGICHSLQTGDIIQLDGERGTLTKVIKGESPKK